MIYVLTSRIEIGDGISLCVVKTDKFKNSTFSVNFITKLNENNAAKNTLAMSVLRRGCTELPTLEQINRKLDMLYAAGIAAKSTKLGELHICGLEAYMLGDRYIPDEEQTDIQTEVIDLLFDILFDPFLADGAFVADYVESEKKNLIESINSQINNKSAYAMRRCVEEMCRGELYAVNSKGSVAAVEAVTPQTLYEHYLHVVTGAKVEIVYVGDCDENILAKQIKTAFSRIRRQLSMAQPRTKVKLRAQDELKEVDEALPVNQGKLCIGFRTGRVLQDRNYASFTLFNELFGGTPEGKLFMNVRERLSLCYYCFSRPDDFKGIMVVSCGIDDKNKQKAQDEILAQLEAIRNGEITKQEFEMCKVGLINRYKEILDDADALVSWFLARSFVGLMETPEQAAKAITYLTQSMVIAAAKEVTPDTVYFLHGDGNADQSGETGDAEQ